MEKLKLNPVVLDTISKEDLKQIIGGEEDAETKSTAVPGRPDCVICEVEVTPPKKTEDTN